MPNHGTDIRRHYYFLNCHNNNNNNRIVPSPRATQEAIHKSKNFHHPHHYQSCHHPHHLYSITSQSSVVLNNQVKFILLQI